MQNGARLRVETSDLGEAAHGRKLVAAVAVSPPLEGVWHAAHALSDAALASQDFSALARAYAPKAHGAWLLHAASAMMNLRVHMLFSSVAALLGGKAQANYAAASTCLDAIAVCGREGGGASVSVQWGPLAEMGMATGGEAGTHTDTRESALGLRRLSLADSFAALEAALWANSPAVLGVVNAQWTEMLGSGTAAPALLSGMAPCHEKVSLPAAVQGCGVSSARGFAGTVSLESVMKMVTRTAGKQIDADVPLMSAGIDSLGAVELRNQLQGAAGDSASLPSTVVFDHPTARQLVVVLQPAVDEVLALNSPVPMGQARVGISGHTARLPGAVPAETGASLLSSSSSTVGEVPALRWDASVLLPLLSAAAASAVRHGGLMCSCELFDNATFCIAPAEAAVMDPQQRLVLELGYQALHATGVCRADFDGSLSGVFLGIGANEYGQLLASSPAGQSVYAATGSSHSVACGRLSFVLGLNGACAAYDTACSAALVASHAAVRALQHNECTLGLAAGVNLMLTPGLSASFAIAGMTSPRGRCHTFDNRADGYARSEACAGISLAPEPITMTAAAIVVCGCAVRQDGRSASLTAPNGQAQQALLKASLVDAGATPSSLVLAEAHGTGTALGDPIEVGSLSGAILSKRQGGAPPLAVGGVKAFIGHAEPAAGMTGLLQLALGLSYCRAPANAQLRALNPLVGETVSGMGSVLSVNASRMGGVLPQTNGGLAACAVGGVSSLGYSGVIANALLSGTEASSVITESPPLVLRRRPFPWQEMPREWLAQKSQGSERATFVESSLHVMSWSRIYEEEPTAAPTDRRMRVLLIDPVAHPIFAPPLVQLSVHHQSDGDASWDAILFVVPRISHQSNTNSHSDAEEVHLLLAAFELTRLGAMPVWICTAATQAIPNGEPPTRRACGAGLWGLARTCRQDVPSPPVWCVDVHQDHGAALSALSSWTPAGALHLLEGSVRGLQCRSSLEPQVGFRGPLLHVPRLVELPSTHAAMRKRTVALEGIRRGLDAHTASRVSALDIDELGEAYRLLDALCAQYVVTAVQDLSGFALPLWHHRLLYAWCAKVALPSRDTPMSATDVSAASGDIWAELQLAERCGAQLSDTLTGKVPYQELLFPGGSLDMVRPVYEQAHTNVFYNDCVVAAVQLVVTTIRPDERVIGLEIGAGTGGTSSSLLPILDGSCERYVFTDVSDVFLREARRRFVSFPFVEYVLLNIDADPGERAVK